MIDSRCDQRTRRGFSRLEAAAVAVIVIVLLCLLLPALLQSRQAARRNTCEYRLTDAGLTMLFVAELRPGREFPGYVNEQAVDASGQRRKIGWAFELLPYLSRPAALKAERARERNHILPLGELPGPDVFGPRRKIHEKFGPQGEDNLRGTAPELYLAELLCPDDPRSQESKKLPWLSYVANCGQPDAQATKEFPADWPASGVFLERFENRDPEFATSFGYVEEHDGASYTLMLSENADAGKWTGASEAEVGFLWAPGTPEGMHTPDCAVLFINESRGQGDGSVRFARPSSYHPGGVLVMYCDGRTRFLDEQIDFRIYCAQMTSDGASTRQPGTDKLLDPPYRDVRE